MRQRYTLRPQPTPMLRGTGRSSVDSSFHAFTLSATTWKIWEVSAPTATRTRNENRKIVLHDRPSLRHKTLNRRLSSEWFSDFKGAADLSIRPARFPPPARWSLQVLRVHEISIAVRINTE